jgi:hypothetical protein
MQQMKSADFDEQVERRQEKLGLEGNMGSVSSISG